MTDPYIIVYTICIIFGGISAISEWALLIAILRDPKVRSNTFNLYLIFSLVPDAYYFLSMTLINVVYLVEYCGILAGGEEWPRRDVIFSIRWWNEFYWLSTNMWMSFLVFVQIYKLLTANKRAKRYDPPTRKRVIKDSTIIHICSGVVASLFPLIRWLGNKASWSDREYRIFVLGNVYSSTVHANTANYRYVLWSMVEQVTASQECKVPLVDIVLCKVAHFSVCHGNCIGH